MKYTIACAFALALFAVPGLAQTNSVTIPMHARNGSGENGTATLTQGSDGVHVSVSLANGTSVPQPTHIHIGTCAAINKAPEYPLKNTVDGKSDTTVLGVTLDALLRGHYAINVHKSATDLGTYVSCGDIRS
jgi:hypothetical protein